METQREAIIRVEGSLDLPAARFVEHSLKRMSVGDRVRIDFTRVRQFHDYGIAVLAQALKKHEAIVVRLDGLGMHQVRMLRYFGVDSEAFRRDGRARGLPEEGAT